MMPYKSCFIPKCGNNNGNTQKLFLMVPRDDRRSKWFSQINSESDKTAVFYCCEDHFNLPEDAENWIHYKEFGSRIELKKDVVPHLYLDKNKLETTSQISSSSKQRKMHNLEQFEATKPGCSRELFPDTEIITEEFDSPKSKKNRKDIVSSPSGKFYVTGVANIGVQTNDQELVPKKTVATKTDMRFKIPAATVLREKDNVGVDSSSSSKNTDSDFHSELTLSPASSESPRGASCGSAAYEAIIEIQSKFYTGLPKETYFIIKLLCNNNTNWDKLDVLLTLKKIKLNDPYHRLADDFKISASKAGQIFRNDVPIMSGCLKQLIYWPKSDDIKMRLPVTFWYRYKNVESLIDCFEIEIQKPSDPVKQSHTWSDYKKCNTIKYLVSSTPYGLVNFCSTGFGGRTSDKLLFENCGFLNVLKNNTDVMADRGFKHTAVLLSKKQCNLIRPPSVKVNEKLTKSEVKESKRIASLRIHIERVIGRIREFSMLNPHALVHNKYMYFIDNIVSIVCGIINIQGTLL